MSFRIVALALVLGGCTAAEPVFVDHTSVLGISTRGMALSRNGLSGYAGMYGTTCDFDTRRAAVGADYDFAGDEDTVTDGVDQPGLGLSSVVVSNHGVHVVRPESGEVLDIHVKHPVHGVQVGDDVVVIGVRDEDGDCVAGWWHAGDGRPWTTFEVPDDACDPDTEVDTDHEEAVFVATDEGVLVLTEDGWVRIDVTADLLAWDPWSGALYAADRGQAEVRAHELDGKLRWSVETDGKVRALDHLGEQAAASVSVATADGGALVVLDGATGEVRADLATPAAATDLVVSANGRMLGLVLEDETHFYRTERPQR